MPTFRGELISIVLLGRHNPQILNHDFLLKHGVLSVEQEPFVGLLQAQKDQKGPGFTEFISTPVLTSLKYGPVGFMVEDGRFQIFDERFGLLAQTPIVEITRRYFGQLLRYTPLRLGGLNLTGSISFTDQDDERRFDERLELPLQSLRKLVGSEDVRAGLSFSFPWKNGTAQFHLPRSREAGKPAQLGLNYEFSCGEIEAAMGALNHLPSTFELLQNCLKAWSIEVPHDPD